MEQEHTQNGQTDDLLALDDAQIGFDAAIHAAGLKGVMGIRFFNPKGQFTDAFPANIQSKELDQRALHSLLTRQPFSRFQPHTPLTDVFIYLPEFASGNITNVPILEVTVPLHRKGRHLAGAAQFIVEGQSIANEYARLDRYLISVASLAFLVAGSLLATLLWLTFGQVQRLNRQLALRHERLVRANQELALAARASALGSVSAHLMHGLKNPLASLSQFMNSWRNGETDLHTEDWQDALTAARRMQSLVEQTLEVLSDAQGQPAYQISIPEMAKTSQERVAQLAQHRKVQLLVHATTPQLLSSRVANLVCLILVNLLENAVQASPPNQSVSLTINLQADRLLCRVQDHGPGFPEHLRKQLFLPCKSTREGGSGIGLAICKQLADHLGATLDLEEPAGGGCLFQLGLPVTVLNEGLHLEAGNPAK